MKRSIKKIVITGGGGVLGYSFLERLKNSNVKILVLDKNIEKSRIKGKNIKFLKCDIANSNISKFLEGTDCIIHLASIKPKGYDISFSDYLENVKMTINIVRNNKKAKIIYTSGSNVYGDTKRVPIKEEVPVNSRELYGLSKISSEMILDVFSKKNGWPLIILRIANIYGPGFKREGGVLFNFFSKLSKNKPLEIYGNKDQKRDRVWIDDVIDALILAINSNAVGTFNIGSGESHSTIEVAKLIGKYLKKKPRFIFKKNIGTEKKNLLLDIAKARKSLNYKPRIGFKKGLELLIDGWSNLLTNVVYIDLDGTILDVSERIYRVYCDILKKYKKKNLNKEIFLRMKRDKKSMKDILKKTGAGDIVSQYDREWLKNIERPQYLRLDRLPQSKRTVLANLKRKNSLILVTSRRNKKTLYNQLRREKIYDMFEKIMVVPNELSAKTKFLEKQIKGKKNNCFLVGDTESYILVGKKLGIKTIAVSDGVRSKNFLKRFSPEFLINNIKSLPKIISSKK